MNAPIGDCLTLMSARGVRRRVDEQAHLGDNKLVLASLKKRAATSRIENTTWRGASNTTRVLLKHYLALFYRPQSKRLKRQENGASNFVHGLGRGRKPTRVACPGQRGCYCNEGAKKQAVLMVIAANTKTACSNPSKT